MEVKEIKALISLLDDEDLEIRALVNAKIRSLGGSVIPHLENEWENQGLTNPNLQKKLEEIIHDLQYEQVYERLLVWAEGGGLDLLEGFWILATYQYPDFTYEKLKAEIEQIFYEVWIEFRPNMHPVDQIKVLNSVFFDKLKFGPNTKNFHSASNSMINVVLETHKGNPTTLCTIYMLIAKKLNIPLYGVNLPNIFVLTYKTPELQFYINVFNKGIIFYKSDIDNYLAQLNLKQIESFYNPCSHIDIVKRVLTHLNLAFEKTAMTEKVEEIKKLIDLIGNFNETPI